MKKMKLAVGALLLTAGLFVSSLQTVHAEAVSGKEVFGEGEYKVVSLTRGDMDGNGKITVRDALRVMQMALKVTEADDSGDVDYDGTVAESDVILELKAAMFGGCSHIGYEKPVNENVIIVDSGAYPAGNYCFQSSAAAAEYLNDNPPASEAERKVVLFAPGVHRERITLKAPFVTFRAMDINKETKLTFYYGTGNSYDSAKTWNNAASVFVEKSADDFHAEYLTFENSYNIYVTEEELTDQRVSADKEAQVQEHRNNPPAGQTQAQAFYSKADRQVFDHCKFYGRQDTLYVDNGRMYFKDCYVEGTVDFIYGCATAVFENCQINSPYNGGYVTAASTKGDQQFGFLFNNCTLTKEAVPSSKLPAPKQGAYTLGRPWGDANGGDNAMVTYWNCKMDDHIQTGRDRFADMSIKREDARFAEVGSMDINGNALDLKTVCPSYETVLTQEDMTGNGSYAPWRWLYGDDQWNPAGYEIP